jgi:limonene-1,2-epoxide hydrolase
MRPSKRRKMASLDAMDVATRFVNAANQHDPDSLVACVHRDFQSIQPVHPDRNFRGVRQLRNNWEAIFRTEPGFRLTVLRATATEDTVWMELHGAGDDDEAAGTFILGVEDGRILWVRVYSDIVQAPPELRIEAPEPVLTAATDVADPHVADPDVADPDVVDAAPEGDESSPASDEENKWEAVVADNVTSTEVPGLEMQGEPLAADEEEGDAGDEEPEAGQRKGWRRRLRGKAKS